MSEGMAPWLFAAALGVLIGALLPRSVEAPVSVYQPKTYLDMHERTSLSYLHAIEKDRALNGESLYDVEHCVAVCLCLHRNIGCGPLGIPEEID